MRLYLSSYGLGNQPHALVDLLGANKRAAIISNAGDYHTETEIAERIDSDVAAFAAIGIEAQELDLKQYFGKQAELAAALGQYGLVWLRGGNSFVLQRAIDASGFTEVIKTLLAKDEIVYGGYSAGAVVASPNLRGIDIVDDPNMVPEGYSAAVPWQGMHLIDYSIAPHYRSNHPESEAIERTVEYFEHQNMPYRALRDGQVIVIKGSDETVLE